MADADPYRYFRIEAAELLEQLTQGALAIDRGDEVPGGVAALLRQAHTLKGAARVVKQLEIAEHAHAIEDVLSPQRGASRVPRECGVALHGALDAIRAGLAALGASSSAGWAEHEPESLRSVPPDEPVVLRAEVAEVQAVVDGLGESLVELAGLDEPLRLLERARQLSELIGRQLAAPRRVDPDKLVQVLERSQRVAEDLRAGLARLDRGLRNGVSRLGRQLTQTHEAAERLRLVPAASIFTSLERAAYDAARELGRDVRFDASGGDLKLDSHLLVVAQGALLHVVRNAVVHGLEPEAARREAGKPAHGTISLAVARSGHQVLFTCSDDGGGLDLDRLRLALAREGEDAAALTEQQALARLLRGGISTAERLTRLSGRGIGLDVLRAAGEELGGSVELHTRRGEGFRVQLRVPLSIASVSAVAVECGTSRVSVPLDAVVESVRFSRAEIARGGAHESVCHDGRVLSFAPLSALLGGPPQQKPRSSWTSLIVKGGGARVAIGVDRLLGARTVVVRPVPELAGARAIVAGATLDALGNPELVLDGDALVERVQGASAPASGLVAVSRPILVIDDSLTTRMLEQSILESAGYEVTLATSGEEGLEMARREAYALFLVDVEMPGIDGFTFIERARREPALAGVPAVLVSSRSAPEDLERGKQVGAQGYIVKGRFDQRELLDLIERLVSP